MTFSATTATVTGLGTGTYTVIVTDANGCTSSNSTSLTCHRAQRHEDSATNNIDQLTMDVSLYPNPTNGQFTAIGLDKGMTVEVYDYMGRLLSKTIASSETMTFNLSGQSNGIYLVRIIASDGTLVKETKMLKVE